MTVDPCGYVCGIPFMQHQTEEHQFVDSEARADVLRTHHWDMDTAYDAGFEDGKAEARADVDGLVAQIAELGWTGLPQYAIAYAAAIRDVLALLAGKEDDLKAELDAKLVCPTCGNRTPHDWTHAGDKAEAPHDE